MKPQPPTPYTVFYDGNCIVCDTEVNYYLKMPHEGRLQGINIAAPEFDATDHGPSYDDFMAQMHLRSADGQWFLGVDAFTLMWRALPGRHWHLMAWLIQIPVLRTLARFGYRIFARNRHRLPRRSCNDGTCEIKKPF